MAKERIILQTDFKFPFQIGIAAWANVDTVEKQIEVVESQMSFNCPQNLAHNLLGLDGRINEKGADLVTRGLMDALIEHIKMCDERKLANACRVASTAIEQLQSEFGQVLDDEEE